MRAAYKNRYGYSILSIVVDDDARTATLYNGYTAPIGHYVKKSKKDIRQLFNLYRLAGYETEEKQMILRYFFDGVQYAIEYDAQHIIFTNCDSGKKTAVKVLDSADFTWKLNKKSIAAAGGARGLFCFFGDAIKADFMTAYINRTIVFYGA